MSWVKVRKSLKHLHKLSAHDESSREFFKDSPSPHHPQIRFRIGKPQQPYNFRIQKDEKSVGNHLVKVGCTKVRSMPSNYEMNIGFVFNQAFHL